MRSETASLAAFPVSAGAPPGRNDTGGAWRFPSGAVSTGLTPILRNPTAGEGLGPGEKLPGAPSGCTVQGSSAAGPVPTISARQAAFVSVVPFAGVSPPGQRVAVIPVGQAGR